jgi:integrase
VVKRNKSKASRKQERQDARPFIHGKGTKSERWAKKCRGRLVYLGKVAADPDGEAAWLKWLDIRDDVRAGRKPRPKVPEGLLVKDLANHWLTSKRDKMDAGELAFVTFRTYKTLAALVVETLGKNRAVSDLRPDDFAGLRAVMAKRWGPVMLSNSVQYVRGMFRFAFDNQLIDKPVLFGTAFVRPTAKTLRQARNGHGPRMFTPAQLHAMLDKADPTAKAMLLIAANCALGNSDLAALPIEAVDLETGWLNFPRGKTAIGRRIPLWPETTEAVRAALACRPKAAAGAAKYLLLSRRGRSLLGKRDGGAVASIFHRVATAAGVEGRTFYDLRRTFQTVAEDSRDLTAVQSIMGHAAAANDMSAIYRQRISDDRLRAVVNVVHDWLFGGTNPIPAENAAAAS